MAPPQIKNNMHEYDYKGHNLASAAVTLYHSGVGYSPFLLYTLGSTVKQAFQHCKAGNCAPEGNATRLPSSGKGRHVHMYAWSRPLT